jgi:hypothetical protein
LQRGQEEWVTILFRLGDLSVVTINKVMGILGGTTLGSGSLAEHRDFQQGLAPDALLTIGGGNYQGCVVRFGGVIIDHGCGLGAEVARLRVEVQRADAVFTLHAGELHAALDALDSVGFHYLIVFLCKQGRRSVGRAPKVTQ